MIGDCPEDFEPFLIAQLAAAQHGIERDPRIMRLLFAEDEACENRGSVENELSI